MIDDRHLGLIRNLRHLRSLVDSIRHETNVRRVSAKSATGVNAKRWKSVVPALIETIIDLDRTNQEILLQHHVILMMEDLWQVELNDFQNLFDNLTSQCTRDRWTQAHIIALGYAMDREKDTPGYEAIQAERLDALDNVVVCNNGETASYLMLVKLML